MRRRSQKQYAPLIKGLFTEASPLSAPEGTTSDELNMVLDTNGMIRKPRPGLSSQLMNLSQYPDSITGYPPADYEITLRADFIGMYYWEQQDKIILVSANIRETVSGITPNRAFTDRFIFFIDNETLTVEDEFYWSTEVPTVDGTDGPSESDILNEYNDLFSESVTFAPLRDGLVLTNGDQPLFFTQGRSGLNVWQIDPHVRDFKLLRTDFSIGTRPASIAGLPEYKYNLLNAGWYKQYDDSTGAVITDIIEAFDAEIGVYPSQADIAHLGVRVDVSTGDKYWDPEEIDAIDFGSTEAPRGHYIYPIRRINRESKLSNRFNDGATNDTAVPILINGELPGGGTPSPGTPITDPTPPYCQPGDFCEVER